MTKMRSTRSATRCSTRVPPKVELSSYFEKSLSCPAHLTRKTGGPATLSKSSSVVIKPRPLLRQSGFAALPTPPVSRRKKRHTPPSPFIRQDAHADLIIALQMALAKECNKLEIPDLGSSSSSGSSIQERPRLLSCLRLVDGKQISGVFRTPRSHKPLYDEESGSESESDSLCSGPCSSPSCSPYSSTDCSPVCSPRNSSPSSSSSSLLFPSEPKENCSLMEYESFLSGTSFVDVITQIQRLDQELYEKVGGAMCISYPPGTIVCLGESQNEPGKQTYAFTVKWVMPMDAFSSPNAPDPNEIATWRKYSASNI